ncbi:MAG: hypothetical protein ACI959_000159 [Limisphaerales bacterium]|jgi:hypothetical protein
MVRILIILLFATVDLFAQPTLGLITNETSAIEGFVLFSNNKQTYLIDKCGLVVNSWASNFKPGQAVYLLENGNLLRTAKTQNEFNEGGSGGRFEIYNWEGSLIWFYDIEGAHHDIAPLPNGNFLLTACDKITEEEAQAAGRIYSGDLWSEKIIELQPVGFNQANIVWEWRLWDHITLDPSEANKIYLNYVDPESETSGDWVHLNAIDFKENKILVTSRLFSEIWTIDYLSGEIVSRFGNPATMGSALPATIGHPHNAQWLEDDAILLFNNDWLKAPAQSRVEIWEEDNLIYSYTEAGFYSKYMSGAQRLPNNHILICQGTSGRFFEINESQEIVWEYINPINQNGGPGIQGSDPRFNETFRASHYALDYPAFLDKDMTGKFPIELNPISNECFVPEEAISGKITILGNPFGDILQLESDYSEEVLMKIVAIDGRVIGNYRIAQGVSEIPFSAAPSGLYIAHFSSSGKNLASIHVSHY